MAATTPSALARLQQQLPTALFFLTLLAMSSSLAMQVAQALAPRQAPARLATAVTAPRPPLAGAALSELFGPGAAAQSRSVRPTQLQLILRACFVDRRSGQSAALIASPGDKARRIAIGEEISPGIRLHAVLPDHVLLVRGGQQESLYFSRRRADSGPGANRASPLLSDALPHSRDATASNP